MRQVAFFVLTLEITWSLRVFYVERACLCGAGYEEL